MKKYIEIDIEYIMGLYRSGKSMREIERLTDLSFTKIQKEIKSYEFNIKIKEKYKEIDGKEIIAVCNKTNKEFIDYKNSSGDLTNHLKSIYPNIRIESNYKRKSFEYTNFKFWYDEYFTFSYKGIIKKKTKKCRFCDWETTDIDNISGAYSNHLKNIHSIDLYEHLNRYPNDAPFLKKINDRRFDNIDNYIKCKICGKKLKRITNTHLKKHDITYEEYIEKFNIVDIKDLVCKKSHKILIENRKTVFQPTGNFIKRSNAEKEIGEILTSYNIDYKLNDRTVLNGFETDFLIKKHKLLIEYNGVYYHSEIKGKKDNKYHLNKLLVANSKGYNMIQIFEDEWLFKRELVVNKILHILNIKVPEKKIYARNCKIMVIEDSKIKNDFLNKNHIQGGDKSDYKLGAYYENELVSVMTFDNKRVMTGKNDDDVFELKRFATKKEYNVIGIASKMLKFFVRNNEFKQIISFADLRWTYNREENLYTRLNFKLDKTLNPDYTYISYSGLYKNKRVHKFSYGKNQLKIKYPEIYKDEKTEWEIMQEAGFDRIWDCGKLKYVYHG